MNSVIFLILMINIIFIYFKLSNIEDKISNK